MIHGLQEYKILEVLESNKFLSLEELTINVSGI